MTPELFFFGLAGILIVLALLFFVALNEETEALAARLAEVEAAVDVIDTLWSRRGPNNNGMLWVTYEEAEALRKAALAQPEGKRHGG